MKVSEGTDVADMPGKQTGYGINNRQQVKRRTRGIIIRGIRNEDMRLKWTISNALIQPTKTVQQPSIMSGILPLEMAQIGYYYMHACC